MSDNIPSWNDIPYTKELPPEIKAQEFDLQYAENREIGSDKEYSGMFRALPEGKGTNRQ